MALRSSQPLPYRRGYHTGDVLEVITEGTAAPSRARKTVAASQQIGPDHPAQAIMRGLAALQECGPLEADAKRVAAAEIG